VLHRTSHPQHIHFSLGVSTRTTRALSIRQLLLVY
jgi:hypothetical protein